MNRFTPELRSMNNDYPVWKRINKNGNVECFNRDYYDCNFNRKLNSDDVLELIKQEFLYDDIKKELNN